MADLEMLFQTLFLQQLQQLQRNLLLQAQGNQNTPETSQALSNSSIENKETLRDVVMPPSRYRKLFCDALQKNNDVTRVDNSDDGDNDKDDEDDDEDEEEEEEELDWVGEVKGGTEDELPAENERFCKKCKKNLTPETSVRCQKCHWATYCGEECKDKNESRHAIDCDNYIKFRKIENAIRNQYKIQEMNLGRCFGHLKDVPSLEHDFLGGSKISVVIKLGPRIHDNVFLCEDLHGQRANIKFEEMEPSIIQKVVSDHEEILIVIFGARFENLVTSGTRKDFGFVEKTKSLDFYRTWIAHGERVINRFNVIVTV